MFDPFVFMKGLMLSPGHFVQITHGVAFHVVIGQIVLLAVLCLPTPRPILLGTSINACIKQFPFVWKLMSQLEPFFLVGSIAH